MSRLIIWIRNAVAIVLVVIYIHGCGLTSDAVSLGCTHGNCKHGWYSKYNKSEKNEYLLWAVGFPIIAAGAFVFLFQSTFRKNETPKVKLGKSKFSFPPSGIKCPICGADMVKRKAFRGPNKGNLFWGCPNYPSCKGIININSRRAH